MKKDQNYVDRLQYTQGAESDKLWLLIQSRKLNQSNVGIIVKIWRNFDDPRRKMIS